MGDRIRIQRANTAQRRNEPAFIVEPAPPPPPPTSGNRRNRPQRERIIEDEIVVVEAPPRRRNTGRNNLNPPAQPPPPPPQVTELHRRRPKTNTRSRYDEKPAIIEIVNDSRSTRRRPHSPPRPPIPTPRGDKFIAKPTIHQAGSNPSRRGRHHSRIHDDDSDGGRPPPEPKGKPVKVPLILGAGGPGIKDVTAGKKNGRVFLARTRTVRSAKKRPTVIKRKPDSPEGSI